MDDQDRVQAWRDEVIPAAPLYDPTFEHDACGVGFVAETRRGPSRRVVPLALAALAAMAHRGALGADARTSDGSGLSLPLGPELLERLTARLGSSKLEPERLAVGMVFLPQAAAARGAATGLIERCLAAEGLATAGWRNVPVDAGVLGDQAAASQPVVRQVIVVRPDRSTGPDFERRLFLARRAIEQAV
ncbi:MAG TPA: hypothetical protein VIB99_08925, partial [Candidatus Limnocylindrales bacterium]